MLKFSILFNSLILILIRNILNNVINGYKSQNNKLTIELGQINKEKENEINSLKFTIELQKKETRKNQKKS